MVVLYHDHLSEEMPLSLERNPVTQPDEHSVKAQDSNLSLPDKTKILFFHIVQHTLQHSVHSLGILSLHPGYRHFTTYLRPHAVQPIYQHAILAERLNPPSTLLTHQQINSIAGAWKDARPWYGPAHGTCPGQKEI